MRSVRPHWWLSGKESTFQFMRCKRCRFDLWVGKIPCRRKWQPTPVFLPGESSWTEEPGGLQTWLKRLSMHTYSYSSASQLCPTLRNPMDCSIPGFPALHHLPELAQTQVHWVDNAIQPPHPLSTPSPAFNLSQHQGLFQWVSSSHQVAKVLELQLQHQSFQWIFRVDFLEDWLVWSPGYPRDSQESSPTPQFKSINSAQLSLLYGLTSTHDYWKNHSMTIRPLSAKYYLCFLIHCLGLS